MSTIEHEIIQRIQQLDEEHQRQVLDFIQQLEAVAARLPAPTLEELLQLPYEERNRLIAATMARTQNEDIELFEANTEADFDDESL